MGPLLTSDKVAFLPASKPEAPSEIHVVSVPPCSDLSGRECYAELRAQPKSIAVTVLTFVFAAAGFFVFFAVILQMTLGRFPILRGTKLEVVINVTSQETMSVSSNYEDLSTLEDQLIVPLEFHFYYPTLDTARVLITSCDVTCTSTTPTVVPRFEESPYFKGEAVFPKEVSGPVTLTVNYEVTKNFALNLPAFRARWGTTSDRDDFAWFASAAWDEVQLRFTWPPSFHCSLAPNELPQCFRIRGAGARREKVADGEWTVNGRTWILRVTNVEPHQRFLFEWKLLDPSQPAI